MGFSEFEDRCEAMVLLLQKRLDAVSVPGNAQAPDHPWRILRDAGDYLYRQTKEQLCT
jgi:hypothetical protein